MAKDVKKEAAKTKPAEQDAQPSRDKPAPKIKKKKQGSSLNQAAVNIGVHSLLMVLVPFTIFFASAYGFLDRKHHGTDCFPPLPALVLMCF
jgi:hypothetical protein